MRALQPDEVGVVDRDGVRIYWERLGDGGRRILFLPCWSIVHSRTWKFQLAYFARHFRVLTFDPRGNGRSGRPADAAAYAEAEFAADALAVLDATGTERASIVGFSLGGQRGVLLAADHPERVDAAAFIGPTIPLAPPHSYRVLADFDELRETYEGWQKYNRNYWLRDYPDFVEFFLTEMFPEPHSTKQIEDGVKWGLETTPEVLIASHEGPGIPDEAAAREVCARVQCPVLVIHGDKDRQVPHARGAALAEATGGTLVTLE